MKDNRTNEEKKRPIIGRCNWCGNRIKKGTYYETAVQHKKTCPIYDHPNSVSIDPFTGKPRPKDYVPEYIRRMIK